MVDMAKEWVERDAALVWHGFTQMSSFSDNAPIMVERAEGRYLIDVDGNRYLDAISSLWVNTLGHRVPELDAALRDQLDKVAHSTMLGNGNRIVVELAEALADVVPVDAPHFLFASDGASAVEQALKIAFQFWTNQGEQGRTKYLAFADAYHGDTVGAISLGAAASAPTRSTRCAFRWFAPPATTTPIASRPRPRSSRATRTSWPSPSSNRSCRARAACAWPTLPASPDSRPLAASTTSC